MFIKRFLPVLRFRSVKIRFYCAHDIAPGTGVSASRVRRPGFDEHALLAHDLAHKRSFKSRPIEGGYS
jgi:hypothetical protein